MEAQMPPSMHQDFLLETKQKSTSYRSKEEEEEEH
jgi:hypothetical protein